MLSEVTRTQLQNVQAGNCPGSETQVTDPDFTLLAEAVARLARDFRDFKHDVESKFGEISP